jgi:hypothetical protein
MSLHANPTIKPSYYPREMMANHEKGESSQDGLQRALDEAAFNMASLRKGTSSQPALPLTDTNASPEIKPDEPGDDDTTMLLEPERKAPAPSSTFLPVLMY